MLPVIKGRQLLDVLSDIKEPALLTDIVDRVDPNDEHPKRELMKDIKSALDIGVQYGYVEKRKNRYYMADDKGADDVVNTSVENSSDSEMEVPANSETNVVVEELNQNPGDCYDYRRGMRRRRSTSGNRRSRSRSRLAPRKSSRRRRR